MAKEAFFDMSYDIRNMSGISCYTPARSVCWFLAGGWLVDTSAELREAVAH